MNFINFAFWKIKGISSRASLPGSQQSPPGLVPGNTGAENSARSSGDRRLHESCKAINNDSNSDSTVLLCGIHCMIFVQKIMCRFSLILYALPQQDCPLKTRWAVTPSWCHHHLTTLEILWQIWLWVLELLGAKCFSCTDSPPRGMKVCLIEVLLLKRRTKEHNKVFNKEYSRKMWTQQSHSISWHFMSCYGMARASCWERAKIGKFSNWSMSFRRWLHKKRAKPLMAKFSSISAPGSFCRFCRFARVLQNKIRNKRTAKKK